MKRALVHRSLIVGLLVSSSAAQATAPTYDARFLGPAVKIEAMNASGQVVGWRSVDGDSRGWIAGSETGMELLPLPPGMRSSFANDVNDAGVVVGSVGAFYSPEFGGRAVLWMPDGGGGYEVIELGMLPGHTSSKALALNDVGDVVGSSTRNSFRYPVLFTPDGPVDLSFTGIFDPIAINDHRVLVDQSFTTKRLDLDTMIVQDLGVPTGGSQDYVATYAEAINERNQVAGLAILATGTNCDRQPALYTDGLGWQVLAGCGSSNSAYDVNTRGDVFMRLPTAPWIRLASGLSFRIEDQIRPTVGHWYVVNGSGGALDDAGRIALIAHNPSTGESGALLLTPQGNTAPGAPLRARWGLR